MKKKLVLLVLLFVLLPCTVVLASDKQAGNTDDSSSSSSIYQIYPLPHHEKDLGTGFEITDKVNIVVEDGVDKATVDFLHKMLDKKKLTYTTTDAVKSGQTNILLGTNDSDGYVDQYMKENVSYDQKTFSQIDPYVLSIDKNLEDQGAIAILGKDTESVYYGLASLSMIMDQLQDRNIHSVQYEDYSDTKWRGFIEGFYGFPWSHEERISLMKFGGKLKMNAYIFGPKDDKYHNREWRTPYPKEELKKIEELAAVGNETKTHFIWAIHPGFNMIDWDDYDNELDTLLNKLDQLYGAGVRQFGLFMDDISTAQAAKNTDKHVQLIKDIDDWINEKGDVKPLVYTPPFYNQAWTDAAGEKYLQALSNLPENVEIMWTGDKVIGSINEKDMAWPKQFIERDPFVWLNWPVNGYAGSRLLLGKGELLQKGTHNISGVVSNPLEQAELSKVALFAVSDFAWNVDDFDDTQSWKDSFHYIDPEAADELHTLANHLSDPSPNSRGVVFEESENIKEDLEQFSKDFTDGKLTAESGEKLIGEFDHVLQAITDFNKKSKNEAMKKEFEPWLNSLHDVLEADKHAVKSAVALQNEDVSMAWEELAKAADAMAKSKQYTVKKLNDPDVKAEAGMKRLVPFANDLITQLDTDINTAINPDATAASIPISSYENQDFSKMVDGDEDTYAYVQVIQKNGDWYGLDLGKTTKVEDVHILQGRTDDDHDIFQKGVLEYSTDGKEWKAIGEERSGFKIDAQGLQIDARYIRYRLTHAGVPGGKPDLWTAVRKFTVNDNQQKASAYTNVSKWKDVNVHATENTATIQNVSGVTLQPKQYIGIALPTLEHLQTIKLQTNVKGLQLEVSENGVEWEKAATDDDAFPDAAYVRIINSSEKAITFDLQKLEVQLKKFAAPKVTHNYDSVYEGKIDNLFDGDVNSRVWFGSKQAKGNYVQVDLGGVIDVENIGVAINDGEKDFFRQGDLQVSADGQDWQTIHSFEHPDDVSLNFPDHEAPLRFKRVETDGVKARYVRLISTSDNNAWLALNEIIVNEGNALPGNEDLTIHANPAGAKGYEAGNAIDQKLSTYYQPETDGAGELSYKFVKNTDLEELIILQNPAAISGAKVSIRDAKGWHDAGILSESLHAIDTSAYDHVLEVKLAWDGKVRPQIHDIIPVKSQGPAIETVQDIKALTDELLKGGDIANEQTLHALQIHLTAVQRFAKQEKAEKVVKHMEGFKALLKQQKQQKNITDDAYDTLQEATETYVKSGSKGGQTPAVIK